MIFLLWITLVNADDRFEASFNDRWAEMSRVRKETRIQAIQDRLLPIPPDDLPLSNEELVPLPPDPPVLSSNTPKRDVRP